MSAVSNWFTKFWEDEEGLQTLEIMLIIAVIVVIALAFRKQISSWVKDLLDFGGNKVKEFQSDK
ncbi:Flp1 family type IVb pilin [Cytobacillus massiliigabonensis]|uniref:Flp1 family type IVb pilin n=1 Tax=Cytobacillus massiliigabonensis TaxID=1871011 RepID=UPI000C850940|nr:Flp1 family type IVb pilin [Cytobacillus massiliigabonensis]